jgi:hypothetical protein
MPSYVVVSREQHANKAWRRFENYQFAATEMVLPLIVAELPKAAVAMPVGFVEQGGAFGLVALLSTQPGRNLFVAPDGRWLGRYIPAAIRGYPFALGRPEGAQHVVLCVDDTHVTEAGAPDAETFFDAEGVPAPILKSTLEFLSQMDANRTLTQRTVAALVSAGVVVPWAFDVDTPDGRRSVTGLHRVDEARLNALDDVAFLGLRKSGALALAYAQLLSMGLLGIFQTLAQLHAQIAQAQAPQQHAFEQSFDAPRLDEVRFDLSNL